MLPLVADKFCLPNQHPGMGGQRASVGVVAHAVLSHPDSSNAGIAHQLHSAMGHAGARPKQQHRDARRRDLDDAFFVRHGNGTVLSPQRTVFQIQKRHPVFYLWQCLQIRPDHARKFIHGQFLRAGSSSSQGRRLCRGRCPDTASPGMLPGLSPAGRPHKSLPAA